MESLKSSIIAVAQGAIESIEDIGKPVTDRRPERRGRSDVALALGAEARLAEAHATSRRLADSLRPRRPWPPKPTAAAEAAERAVEALRWAAAAKAAGGDEWVGALRRARHELREALRAIDE